MPAGLAHTRRFDISTGNESSKAYNNSILIYYNMGSITKTSYDLDIDILIVGGGFSGCYSLYALRKLCPTPSIKLVEAASDFGGVWYYNRYPGARVDSEWPQYQFSIPEVWKDWTWKERFPDHNEIKAYLKHMVDVLDLRRDAIFNTIVDKVIWDDSRKKWDTYTRDGKVFTSKHVVVCSGSSYKRHYPDFKGLQNFQGTMLHSSDFPEGDVDVTGKRVGVVGAGATGVQIVQELAKQDCELINFVRTPNIALPLGQRKIDPEEEKKSKSGYEDLFKYLKTTKGGFANKGNLVAFKDATNEERDAIMQKAWDEGGFAVPISTFSEFYFDKEANAYMYNYWANKVRARISDPEKQQIMAPLPQQDFFGTRRTALEHDYYESVDRPNVKLVNLRRSPISEIVERGAVTEDGTLHELDVLILATGYDALNGSQMALGLHDRDGRSLKEKWSKGTETYLGITIPGMPNVWMSYGPQGRHQYDI